MLMFPLCLLYDELLCSCTGTPFLFLEFWFVVLQQNLNE